jgi:hypothetical protein
MAQATQEVIDIEKRFWGESSNPDFFKQHMADDALTAIEPMGFIDKKSALEMSKGSEPWNDLEMEDLHVVELTPDCIAVAYHGRAVSGKSNKPYQGAICSVYVKRDGRWQLGVTSHQPWQPKQE